MCYRLVERYSLCRCLYHKHNVDVCAAANMRGHRVSERTIYVGLLCYHHRRSNFGSDEGSGKVKRRNRGRSPPPGNTVAGQREPSITPVYGDGESSWSAPFDGVAQPTMVKPIKIQKGNGNSENPTKLLAPTKELNNSLDMIYGTVEKGNQVKSMAFLEEDLLDEEELEDAEFDSIDEDPLDVKYLETFVATSTASANFKTKLGELKPSNSESVLDVPDDPIDYASVKEPLPPYPRRTGVSWEKRVDITWTCQCGIAFTETITEYQPGAAKALTNEISLNSPVDVEGLAGMQHLASSSSCSSESSGRSFRRSGFSKSEENKAAGTPDDRLSPEQGPSMPIREYVLLCRQSGRDIKLQHAEITTKPCDHSSYYTLHDKYFGRLHKFFHWITLSEIRSVDFVKFNLYWATHVSIDPSDIGVLPPIPSTDYAYTSNTNPPVPLTAVQHFIQYPSHAPRRAHHRPRIPKKQGSPLELGEMSQGEEQGYGLYVREQICWTRVLILEAVFAVVCAGVAVSWCVANGGGVQDWCAIAGTGLAYASIGLGTLQVALQAGRTCL